MESCGVTMWCMGRLFIEPKALGSRDISVNVTYLHFYKIPPTPSIILKNSTLDWNKHSTLNTSNIKHFKLETLQIPNTYTMSHSPISYISSDDAAVFPDCSQFFQNNQSFDTREAAETWVRAVGRENNIFFAISHSKPRHVYMSCERGGSYRNSSSSDPEVKSRNAVGTKKHNCQFQVKLHERYPGEWRVAIREGHEKHNHALGNYPHGHTSSSKLNDKEFLRVIEMLQCGMPPREILRKLKKEFTNNCSVLRHIYNADQKYQRMEMG